MLLEVYIFIVDDKEVKVKYCLELLLGVVIQVVNKGKVNLIVVFSIYDKLIFKEEVIGKLEGVYCVKFNGKSCEVFVNVKLIIDEGVGVYYEVLLI